MSKDFVNKVKSFRFNITKEMVDLNKNFLCFKINQMSDKMETEVR